MFHYYTIEVEATNYCNANCVFCANHLLERGRGFLDVDLFHLFLLEQKKMAKNNLFCIMGIEKMPRVRFCGLGDPLLHPQLDKLIEGANSMGFYTQIVTNGVLLSPERVECLSKSGLNEISISLHSVNPENYKQITGLDLCETQTSIDECANLFQRLNIKISMWRIMHPNHMFRDTLEDELKYEKFLNECNLTYATVLGPSEPWERDGIVPQSSCETVNDEPFWCNKMYFTFNIDWQGNVVLCCNDYNRETISLGNVFQSDFDYNQLFRQKKQICLNVVMPDICKCCRRWRDNEILEILDANGVNSNDFINRLILEFERI